MNKSFIFILGTEFDDITPNHQVVLEGTTAYIACNSSTKPVWMRNETILVGKVFFDSIILVNVHEEDSGIYSCHGTYFNGIPFISTSELLVASKIVYIVLTVLVILYIY